MRILILVYKNKLQDFASLTIIGLVLQITLQIMINIGVNTNLLPPKGTTLPLISYGGIITDCKQPELWYKF